MTNKVYNNVEIAGSVEITGGGNLGENLQALIVELIHKNQYDERQYYISDDSTSPAAKHGGTWEQIKDIFLLAAGDTYTAGSTGGSANAVVVSHTHPLNHTENVGFGGVYGDGVTIQKGYIGTINDPAYNRSFNDIYTLGTTGESGVGKNIPPYLAVYVWRKIS